MKTLLALTVATFFASNALAASVVTTKDGNPVSSSHNTVVTSGESAASPVSHAKSDAKKPVKKAGKKAKAKKPVAKKIAPSTAAEPEPAAH